MNAPGSVLASAASAACFDGADDVVDRVQIEFDDASFELGFRDVEAGADAAASFVFFAFEMYAQGLEIDTALLSPVGDSGFESFGAHDGAMDFLRRESF